MEANYTFVADSSELSEKFGSCVHTLVSGLALAAVSIAPAMFAGVWLASNFLASFSLTLATPAAMLGLILSLAFIPFVFNLASENALRKMVATIACVSAVIGLCIGFQQ